MPVFFICNNKEYNYKLNNYNNEKCKYDLFNNKKYYIARNTLNKFLDDKVLFENDQIYNEELEKAKLDVDEFLMQCRIGGYFDLNELQMVVLETNGSLSFFPKEKYRPTVVNDLNIKINKVNPPTLLVKEGTIFHENLKSINHDVDWLERELNVLGVPLSDIILMYQEDNSNLGVYTINEIEKKFN